MMQTEDKVLAWEKFIETRLIREDIIPVVVANSWRRSWSRISPLQDLKIPHLSSEHFLATQVASFDLVSIAKPIMEDAYQYIEHSGTAIMLVNGAGYVLEMVGDNEMLARLKSLGIDQGSVMAEERIGTSAIGLALIEQTPVQVVGTEHYCKGLHDLAGAAAPIFDLTGRSLGALGLFTHNNEYHSHSLGLVTAIARAVEGQRQSDQLLEEQNSHLAQLNAILSSITDGIAVWNAGNRLIQVNAAASEILKQPIPSLMGKQVDQLFSLPPYLAHAIQQHEPLNNVEVSLSLNNHTVNCIVSLYFVSKKRGEFQWGILILRHEKDVRKLVQNQVGAKAVLTLDDIPGNSVQMQRVRSFVRSAADATASILIRGEAGTGKNALASAVHNAGVRRDGPFVIFACSSIPNELIINELLGYDESISPNRTGGRPSKFELAQAGTLYFQDVDTLPLEAQAVLLNVLELGIMQRIGGHRPIEVDVRVIASTSAKMETLIDQKSFRTDLYYRLTTFAITIPPLRERHNDIPFVVDRVIKRLSRQLGYSLHLGEGVMDLLKRYPWPGNVREIEAMMGRAAIQVDGTGLIEVQHLPNSIRFTNHVKTGDHVLPPVKPLNELERETILKTAELCSGNVTQMAKVLGIGRTTLWRRLKALNITPQDYR